MTEDDWDDLQVTEIAQTNSDESDIIFVTCATRDDITKITSKVKNLPNTNDKDDPRIVMYVDPRAKKRYNAIQNIAKTIRQKSDNKIQTTVRNGKFDFLLRQKVKGDNTPWSQIPPLLLDQNLPEIEIGMFKDIYTPTEDNVENEEEEDEEQVLGEEEEQDMSNEIRRQYEEDKARKTKRQLSESETSTNTPIPRTKRRFPIQPPGSEDDADAESDSGHSSEHQQKKILHSTLQEESSHESNCILTKALTMPENSNINTMITRYNLDTTGQNQQSSQQAAVNHSKQQQQFTRTNHA